MTDTNQGWEIVVIMPVRDSRYIFCAIPLRRLDLKRFDMQTKYKKTEDILNLNNAFITTFKSLKY